MVFEEIAGATVTAAVVLKIPAKKLPNNCGYALPAASYGNKKADGCA
jgi:hypothetical protein